MDNFEKISSTNNSGEFQVTTEFNFSSNKITDIQEKLNEEIKEPKFFLVTLEDYYGNFHQIKIYENSNPSEISYNFSKKNNLDFKSMEFIKNKIEKLIEKFDKPDQNYNFLDGNSSIEEVDEEILKSESRKNKIVFEMQNTEHNETKKDLFKKFKEKLYSKELNNLNVKINNIPPKQLLINEIYNIIKDKKPGKINANLKNKYPRNNKIDNSIRFYKPNYKFYKNLNINSNNTNNITNININKTNNYNHASKNITDKEDNNEVKFLKYKNSFKNYPKNNYAHNKSEHEGKVKIKNKAIHSIIKSNSYKRSKINFDKLLKFYKKFNKINTTKNNLIIKSKSANYKNFSKLNSNISGNSNIKNEYLKKSINNKNKKLLINIQPNLYFNTVSKSTDLLNSERGSSNFNIKNSNNNNKIFKFDTKINLDSNINQTKNIYHHNYKPKKKIYLNIYSRNSRVNSNNNIKYKTNKTSKNISRYKSKSYSQNKILNTRNQFGQEMSFCKTNFINNKNKNRYNTNESSYENKCNSLNKIYKNSNNIKKIYVMKKKINFINYNIINKINKRSSKYDKTETIFSNSDDFIEIEQNSHVNSLNKNKNNAFNHVKKNRYYKLKKISPIEIKNNQSERNFIKKNNSDKKLILLNRYTQTYSSRKLLNYNEQCSEDLLIRIAKKLFRILSNDKYNVIIDINNFKHNIKKIFPCKITNILFKIFQFLIEINQHLNNSENKTIYINKTNFIKDIKKAFELLNADEKSRMINSSKDLNRIINQRKK